MLIHCSKKLLDELDIKKTKAFEEKPLFSWHAKIINIDRRKTIVMMNDKSRYVLVLHGLKKKNFLNLDEIILKALNEFFKHQCVNKDVIEEYIKKMGGIKFTKTKNRSFAAKLNYASRYAQFYSINMNKNKIIQNSVSLEISKRLTKSDSNEYYIPIEEFYKDISSITEKPIIKCKAVKIKAFLDLDDFKINREFIIPINFTFKELHKTMQIVFNWLDYHVHDFVIFKQEKLEEKLNYYSVGYHKNGYKPLIKLADSEEAFFYYEPSESIKMVLELGIKISEYININEVSLPYDFAKYTYDYGDNWQHYLIIEEIIDDYSKNHPICVNGIGNVPPEDVGGESGYKKFVEVMKNENHKEYDFLKKWSNGVGYKEFDIDNINKDLKKKFS